MSDVSDGTRAIQAQLQSFEATDFLIRPRRFDTSTALVLWQIGSVGSLGFTSPERIVRRSLAILQQVLTEHYGDRHQVYVYEAAATPHGRPRIQPLRLAGLGATPVTLLSTLFVPALRAAPLDRSMMDRLGLRFER